MSNDLLLLENLRKGDRRAQNEVFESCKARMHRTCMDILGDYHHAEDVMMLAFGKFFSGVGRIQLRRDGSIPAYLSGCMVRESQGAIRRPQHSKPCCEDEFPDAPHEVDFLHGIQRAELEKLIFKLPDTEAAVLYLSFHEFSVREIAKLYKMSQSSVRAFLHKARNSFRVLLTDKGCWHIFQS